MCDENRNEAPFTEEQNQQMIDNGMIATVNAPHNIHCLSIIGQIEGHFLLPPQTKTTKYEPPSALPPCCPAQLLRAPV